MLEIIMAVIIPPVIVGLAGLAMALMVKAFVWLKGKTDHEKVKNIITIIEDAVDGVMATLSDAVIADLQAKSADGKLTMEEAKEVVDMIVAKVKEIIGPTLSATIDKLGIALGELVLVIIARLLIK